MSKKVVYIGKKTGLCVELGYHPVLTSFPQKMAVILPDEVADRLIEEGPRAFIEDVHDRYPIAPQPSDPEPEPESEQEQEPEEEPEPDVPKPKQEQRGPIKKPRPPGKKSTGSRKGFNQSNEISKDKAP